MSLGLVYSENRRSPRSNGRDSIGHRVAWLDVLKQVGRLLLLRNTDDFANEPVSMATRSPQKSSVLPNESKTLEEIDAMLGVDGQSGKYPEFKGNVATVYTHPLSKGGSSGGHYSGNAETYMNVGEAMGRAMVDLLELSK